MDLQAFFESTAKTEPPSGLSLSLQALWWDAKGDWQLAHQHAQQSEDRASMHVHAYLHRKEGDQSNAEYWYRRAGVAPASVTLAEEWEGLARKLLAEG